MFTLAKGRHGSRGRDEEDEDEDENEDEDDMTKNIYKKKREPDLMYPPSIDIFFTRLYPCEILV